MNEETKKLSIAEEIAEARKLCKSAVKTLLLGLFLLLTFFLFTLGTSCNNNYPTTPVYKIEYELNGGVAVNELLTTYEKSSKMIRLPNNLDVMKEGYAFDAWYDNPELTGDAYVFLRENTTGDKKFYAKWNEKIQESYEK